MGTPRVEAKGEWFNPIRDVVELQKLLYGKPTAEAYEEPHQEIKLQVDDFTNKP